MTTVTFDALQFIQRLRKAGINENEAEAIAEAVRVDSPLIDLFFCG